MDKTIAKAIDSNASPITRAAMTATKLTKLVTVILIPHLATYVQLLYEQY